MDSNSIDIGLELAPHALDTVVADAKGIKAMNQACEKATVYAALTAGFLIGIQNLLQKRQGDLMDSVGLPLLVGMGAGSIVSVASSKMRRNCRDRIRAFLSHASPDESLAFDKALTDANLNPNDFR